MDRQKRMRRLAGCLLIVLLGLIVAVCTPKTKVAKVTASDYEVMRDKAKAWATLNDVTHLDELTDGSWHALLKNGLVTTDASGQAQLCPGGSVSASTQLCNDAACHIYLYEKGQLVMRSCSESDLGDADACSGEGAAVFDSCPVTIQTMSADVTGLGTWFGVVYLPELQLTLVIVGEGQVAVTPVLALEVKEQDLAGYTFPRRELGERVVAAGDQGAQFLYTAPDDQLGRLPQGLTQGLPPRTPLPIVDLPVLVGELRPFDPNVEPWVGQVVAQGDKDGFRLSEIPAVQEQPAGQEVFVRGAGGVLADGRVQEAIVIGVSWPALAEEAFGGEKVRFLAWMEDREWGDPREFGYDPEQAQALLAESGADPLVLVLFFPTGDEQLAVMARLMAAQLEEIGVQVQLSDVPAGDMTELVRAGVAGGKSMLWLSRE